MTWNPLLTAASTCLCLAACVSAPKTDSTNPKLQCAPPEATTLPNYEVRWSPAPSGAAFHESFRKRAGVPLPSGRTMVRVHASSKHHTGVEWSIIAVRQDGDQWQVSRIGETTGGLLPRPSEWRPYEQRTLTEEAARELDTLLADECLYREPSFTRDTDIASGGWSVTVDVITPSRSYSFQGLGQIHGLTGRLVNLVTDWEAQAKPQSAPEA